jgi:hypothetical protein
VRGFESAVRNIFSSSMSDIGINSDVDIGTLLISDDVFQSDIFVSDIGITDVDVGCRISPTLRSMSMPTYAFKTPHGILRN